jgi:predicted nucleotidyltransferase
MIAGIEQDLDALAEICCRHGVAKLEAFGSAVRDLDFDSERSDLDFLVTFDPAVRDDLAAFDNLKDERRSFLGRPIDLVEREAVEASRNFIRRRAILREAQAVYG